MKTIWKYEVPITDEFELVFPSRYYKILSFGLDPSNTPSVWVMVDSDKEIYEKTTATFYLYGTGNPIPDNNYHRDFIGSVTHGQFVWHLFQAEL